jgi:beta-lactamase class A
VHLNWSLLVLLSSIVANAHGSSAVDPIEQIEHESGSRFGVVAIDSETGRRIEHRPNERFLMCSTFKLLAAAAVLQRVDRGEENPDRFIHYTQADILAYAPVTKQHVAEGGMKLGALCEAAIEQSDNTAGNLLLQAIGGPAGLTKFARSLGDNTTRLDRMEPELNVWKDGDDRDTTSSAAMSNDLVRLITGDVLSEKSRDLLQNWLLKNETGPTLIRAGVPKDWRVGDKTGRSGQGEVNDVAVLYPPNGARIFIAIYAMAPFLSDEKRSELIANVTREVVNILRPAGKIKAGARAKRLPARTDCLNEIR